MLRVGTVQRITRLAQLVQTANIHSRCVADAARDRAAELQSPSNSSDLPNETESITDAGEAALSSTAASAKSRVRADLRTRRASVKRGATMGEQLAELRRVTADFGGTASVDGGVVDGAAFPALSMTSLSGNRVVICDRAGDAAVTLVLLAYRSFADTQLASWRAPFAEAFGGEPRAQVFDVSVNETFAAQTLSGFVRRLQRSSIEKSAHEFHLSLNEPASEDLELLLPSDNKLFGYALLLDRNARVRFRAAGMASAEARESIVAATKQIILLDEQGFSRR
jgi:ATP10 protein